MSTFHYERYLTHVAARPFAITREKLAILIDLFELRSAGVRLTDEELALRIAAERDAGRDAKAAAGPRSEGNDGAVAVIPIVGVIAYRADTFDMSSGGASAQRIGAMLDRVMADPGVKAVLLDVSSPGGSVEGVPELAAKIRAAAKRKPVVAIANGMAASAAYWLASQATEFVVMPSGQVGSVGVYSLFVDRSEQLAKKGIKVVAISAGEHKLEGAPWEPLSDEGRAYYQAQVDDTYGQFIGDVAKGRGVSTARVKADFGQGRMLDAQPALAAGMVDRVETFDQTVARLVKWQPGTPYGKAASWEAIEVLAAAPPTEGEALEPAAAETADAGVRLEAENEYARQVAARAALE